MRTGEPYPAFYDSTHFAAIRQAFDAAWAVIRAHETEDHKERNRELRSALNEKLVALAAGSFAMGRCNGCLS
jgi:hypothetical protein